MQPISIKENTMTTDQTLELVIGVFKSPVGAGLVLAALMDNKGQALKGVKELATVRRGEGERLFIDEAHDVSTGKAAASGGTIGMLLGIAGGPLGVFVGGATGALVGGLAGKFIDTGIPDVRLREIGKLLEPNTSAIVAFVEPDHVAPFIAALHQGGGTTVSQPVSADLPLRLGEAQATSDSNTTSASEVAEPTSNA
jgi:uncharacterized membrane protein